MKKKILLYACNHFFYNYTKASFASFCENHSLFEWRVIFADVGLEAWQRTELARFGEVVAYPPSTIAQPNGNVWPSARARLMMLTDFVLDDTVLLYIDSDTLIFDNLDSLMCEFVESDMPFAIFVEDIAEWVHYPAAFLWRDHRIPNEFKNQDKWRNAPFANAGVLLAQGRMARELGEIGMSVYEKYNSEANFAEQTVTVSLLYDREIPFMKLPPRYNCLVYEEHITHMGTGPKYVGTRPYFRGESVAIRHFAGPQFKGGLDEALPFLDIDARLLKFARKA